MANLLKMFVHTNIRHKYANEGAHKAILKLTWNMHLSISLKDNSPPYKTGNGFPNRFKIA